MGSTMDFSEALVALKGGARIARTGWNGKGMYIYLESNLVDITGNAYEPCIVMHTAQGVEQPGWLASQMDMLADDWEVVQA